VTSGRAIPGIAAPPPEPRAAGAGPGPAKRGAAALSIASNTTLILLKVVAGTITGSVAVLSEAMHSSIDLIASIVAFISVRKADEPADEEHRYGHEKIENLSAAIEGMLILVGSGVIAYEAIRHLVIGAKVERLGVGIAVLGISAVANLLVGAVVARRARTTESAALEGDAAHLRTDALTSAGVLLGLGLVQLTGIDAFDSITALVVAAAIVSAGINIIRRSSGVLVDEALPDSEMDQIERAVAAARTPEVAGYHKLRARRAGRRRHIDFHVQYRSGTSLERAHELAHEMRDSIEAEIPQADVLIHAEPETSYRERESGPYRSG
jgi:cation diffusion facilitator family transporter